MSKTWKDVEEAALFEPVLHQAVTLVQRGDLTREEALIAAVLGLVEIKETQQKRIIELMNTRMYAPIIVPREP
jgi:hypothetical protein